MSDTERMLSLALIHAASDPGVTREALEEIQGLAKDPQRLRALLESEGLGGEEGEGDEEEEPDPEDVPIGKRYRGSLRPADLIIGKRYRPTVTKAATLPPGKVESDEDTGPALARWYAGWFEALEASGLEVSESDLASAEDELDGTGWCVGRDDDGEWEARATRSLGKKSWRFAHLTKAAQRAPSGYNRASPFHFNGKDYVGGQFIPGKAIEEASPQDRAKLQAAKEAESKKAEASKAVRGATAVDPVALAHTLSQHAGAVELTKAERGNAARAYAALQRHHGDLTLHRIGELAARAEQAWRSITDDDPNSEGLRSYWTRQLAAMAGWVERAKGEGLTGEARGKPVDAVVEEVREGAPAFDVAAHVTSAVGDDPGEWMAYDVHRALEDAPSEMIGAVADHFLARRPDMADKIADAVHDARVDRGLALQTEPSPEEVRDASAAAESLTKFKAGYTPIVSSSLRPGAALFHPDGSRASFVEATSPGWMTIRHQDGITDEVATADWYVTKEEPVSRLQAEPSIIPDLLASRPSDGAEFVKPLREMYYRQEEARATGDAAAVARINAEMAGLKQKEEESRANHAQWRTSMVAALADPSSLSGDDYAAGMAAIEGRKDMAHGNAVKLAMRTLGLSGKKGAELAEQLVSGAEATRAGTAHFAGQPRTGYDKPTAGVNVGVQYRRAEDVYRAIHAAVSDPHFTGTVTGKDGRTYRFVDGKRVAGSPEPADVASGAIKAEIEEYAKLGMSPGDVNSGDCATFAREAVKRIRDAGGEAVAVTPGVGPAHVWVMSGGKHYDAQHPEGVDDPADLTFFQDNPDLLEDGWKEQSVAGDQSTEIPVDNGADAGRIPPGDETTGGTTMSQELNAAQVGAQGETVASSAPQGRKPSEIYREYHGINARVNANGPGNSPDGVARLQELRAEILATMPSMGDRSADQVRQLVFKAEGASMVQAEQDAVRYEAMVPTSPHMTLRVQQAEKDAARRRAIIDTAAGITDPAFWKQFVRGSNIDAMAAARELARRSGFKE